MAARYELKKTSDGQYMFNLKAPNYETILTSERYVSRSGAQQGIEAARKSSPLDERYDRRVSSSTQHYFVLRAANREIVGTSEMYSSRAAMETGILACKSYGPAAVVDDQTQAVAARW